MSSPGDSSVVQTQKLLLHSVTVRVVHRAIALAPSVYLLKMRTLRHAPESKIELLARLSSVKHFKALVDKLKL